MKHVNQVTIQHFQVPIENQVLDHQESESLDEKREEWEHGDKLSRIYYNIEHKEGNHAEEDHANTLSYVLILPHGAFICQQKLKG